MESKNFKLILFASMLVFTVHIYEERQRNYRIEHIYIPAMKEMMREYISAVHSQCNPCDLLGADAEFYYTDFDQTTTLPPFQYSYTPTGTF